MTLFEYFLATTGAVACALALGGFFLSLFWRSDPVTCTCPDALYWHSGCPRHGWHTDEAVSREEAPGEDAAVEKTSAGELMRHWQTLLDEAKAEDQA